jgi:hypothetical protein
MTNLMAYANPPMIFVTPDNVEWTFLQTIPDDDKMDKFRLKNYCLQKDMKCLRTCFRYICNRKLHKEKCKFKLMAMKNTKFGFHVYQHGEHTHPVRQKIKSKNENKLNLKCFFSSISFYLRKTTTDLCATPI